MRLISKKDLMLTAAQSTAFAFFVRLLDRIGDSRPNLLRVLTYHRVDEPDAHPELYPGLISATPTVFDRQMEFLSKSYRVVSLEQVLAAFQGGDSLPPRSVLLTFDDAYQDFADIAWPMLKKHGLSATLFVPTAFPDHPEKTFWWDRLYQAVQNVHGVRSVHTPAGRLFVDTQSNRQRTYRCLVTYLKSLPHEEAQNFLNELCCTLRCPKFQNRVSSWKTLRQLAADGVTLGAHTQNHPLMNRVSVEQARAEAVGSLNDLRRQVGTVLPTLAYPAGGFNKKVAAMLKREGFTCAFTTVRGVEDVTTANQHQLRRLNIGQNTSRGMLQAQLLPSFRHLNRWLS